MQHFAQIFDGLVVEVFPEYVLMGEGEHARNVPLAERYHPDFLAGLVPYDPKNPPIEPEAPPAPAPSVVTMRQARLALLQAGKLAAVNDAVRAIPGPEGDAARIEWEFAATVDRESAMVGMLADALKLDAAGLDALFTTAAAL